MTDWLVGAFAGLILFEVILRMCCRSPVRRAADEAIAEQLRVISRKSFSDEVARSIGERRE